MTFGTCLFAKPKAFITDTFVIILKTLRVPTDKARQRTLKGIMLHFNYFQKQVVEQEVVLNLRSFIMDTLIII